ncbi:MAG: low molecular weight phosphotyrosine protein phosphatase [Weeksellaceae bacterium]|jgi:protein-tyrosine phosphatase|nr:low molecular weight phosphotyrosine protein phosphatase [Weeksellaceae bacterium]
MVRKILMVCLGNICRSPLAEGIMRSKLGDEYLIDSAGTGNWHEGETPDHRAVSVARKFGIDISGLQARQISTTDFEFFDLILVMDESNFRNVTALIEDEQHLSKVKMILADRDVPDPYWGDESDFELVFELLDLATDEIISQFEKL